jgi:hypothetical protein
MIIADELIHLCRVLIHSLRRKESLFAKPKAKNKTILLYDSAKKNTRTITSNYNDTSYKQQLRDNYPKSNRLSLIQRIKPKKLKAVHTHSIGIFTVCIGNP